MEGKEKRSRKDLIKNIAIVFLAIMLVLTFFSNTIMNYSLPEVATKYIEPGNIVAKVRGTGIVTVNDPYKISIKESRTIASVAVKAGDTVLKDQVLFYLEDTDSEELNKAEQELDDLILSYTTALLKGDISNQSFQNIQSGNISSVNGYQARIEAARQKVKNAQANVDSLTRQVAIAGSTSGAVDQVVLDQAKQKIDHAQAAIDTAKRNVEVLDAAVAEVKAEYEELLVFESKKSSAQMALDIAKKSLVESIKGATNKSGETFSSRYGGDYVEIFKEDKKSELAEFIANQTVQDQGAKKEVTATDLYNNYEKIFNEYEAIKDRTVTPEEIEKKSKELDNAKSELQKANDAVVSANNYYRECVVALENLNNQSTQNTVDNSKLKEQLGIQLSDAEAALKKAQEEQTQLLTDVGQELNLSSQNSIIAEKQKEIAKLREAAVGATIVAPMDGTIISVSKTAGEDTMPEEALATMAAAGKGYTVSFSVTNEQAKRATVGELAEIQNSWYYGDLKATLQTIRPDKENPAQKKELTFSVEGEVQDGQSLSLSVGQKSSNYDMLVPNSAIKEDNTGKFILIVEVKNSPLGNRYKARRVDVEVLASDDTQTAIIGDVSSYEYVITTATKPIAAGDLVRISDN